MIASWELISPVLVHRLGWGLVHFLWQGAAVGMLLAAGMFVLRRRSANVRYLVGCLALLAMAASPIVTAALVSAPEPIVVELAQKPEPLVTVEQTEAPPPLTPLDLRVEPGEPIVLAPIAPPVKSEPAQAQPVAAAPWHEAAAEALGPHMNWIVLAWLAGAVGLSLWHLGGWVQLRRLRLSGAPAADGLRRRLADLAGQLRVTRPVRLLTSAAVKVPAAMGMIRPVILLPATAVTGLSGEQLAAVLAHELAHIRRWDYLVNLLQTAVETALFYHPAVWWVSRRVRAERENCCDDLAVAACRDRTTYARALAALVQLRPQPRLAVAASGGKLITRIRRIVRPSTPAPSRRATWLAGALILTTLAAAGAVFYGCGAGPAANPLAETDEPAATQPAVRVGMTPAEGARWSARVQGVRARAYPVKRPFEYGQDVVIRVDVENGSTGERALSVFGGPKTVVHSPRESDRTVNGIPCYVGLSRHQPGPEIITLRPGQSIRFDFVIPHIEQRRPVPTGLMAVWVQLAVRVEKQRPASLLAVAEDIRVVDSAAVKSAVEAIKAAGTKGWVAIDKHVRILRNNPDPATIGLLLQIVDDWSAQTEFAGPAGATWDALGQYRDKRIAARALDMAAKAMSRKLGKHGSAGTFIRILLHNRQYLTRKDVLTLVNHPRLKDRVFATTNYHGWLLTKLLAGVAREQDVPLLAAMMAEHGLRRRSAKECREVFRRYPEAAKPALRKALKLGMKPGEYEPWAHEFLGVGRTPAILPLIAEMLAEFRDDKAVSILEFYGKTGRRMKYVAPACLAIIDSPAAMKALRAMAPNGLEERAKLGDPAAVDQVLARAKTLAASMWDALESIRLRDIVRALGTPEGENVEQWWVRSRPRFVKTFQAKYGFDPDTSVSSTQPATQPAGDGQIVLDVHNGNVRLTSGKNVVEAARITFTSAAQPAKLKGTKEELKKLVEKFFSRNYRDITARKTLIWGSVRRRAKGNFSIRYTYRATILHKEKLTIAQVFTFGPRGQFVSVEDADKPAVAKPAARKEGPREVAEAFLAAVAAGKDREAIRMADPASTVPQQIKDFREIPNLKVLKIARVHADAEAALVVTKPFELVQKGKKQMALLQFTLITSRKLWVVSNIDLETPASAKVELKRFLKAHPKATTAEVPWSKAVNGLQCRLSVVRRQPTRVWRRVNGVMTQVEALIDHPVLEIRNVSDKPINLPLWQDGLPIVKISVKGYPGLRSPTFYGEAWPVPHLLKPGAVLRRQFSGNRGGNYGVAYGWVVRKEGWRRFDPAGKTYDVWVAMEWDKSEIQPLDGDKLVNVWTGRVKSNTVKLRLPSRPAKVKGAKEEVKGYLKVDPGAVQPPKPPATQPAKVESKVLWEGFGGLLAEAVLAETKRTGKPPKGAAEGKFLARVVKAIKKDCPDAFKVTAAEEKALRAGWADGTKRALAQAAVRRLAAAKVELPLVSRYLARRISAGPPAINALKPREMEFAARLLAARAAKVKRITWVYDVRDLIELIRLTKWDAATPKIGWPGRPVAKVKRDKEADTEAIAAELVAVITRRIAPGSWDPKYKLGSIKRMNGQLVVTQTPANQAAIGKLISQLQADRGQRAKLTAGFFQVAGSDKALLKWLAARQPKARFDKNGVWNGALTADEAAAFTAQAVKLKDVRLLASPQIMLLTGQRAIVFSPTKRTFKLGLVKDASQTRALEFQSGVLLDAQVSVAADGKHVTVTAMPEHAARPKLREEGVETSRAAGGATVSLPSGQTIILRLPYKNYRATGVKMARDHPKRDPWPEVVEKRLLADDPPKYLYVLIRAEAIPAPPAKDEPVGDKDKWGEAVGGLAVSLAADRRIWRVGEIPTFTASVRNDGPNTWKLPTSQAPCKLEVDGNTHLHSPTGEARQWRLVKPGERVDGVRILADKSWFREKARNRRLVLHDGQYTFRLAVRPAPARKGAALKPRLRMSNPVTIYIIPAGASLKMVNIRGRVVEEAGGKGRPGVRLVLQTGLGYGLKAVTDANGGYEFPVPSDEEKRSMNIWTEDQSPAGTWRGGIRVDVSDKDARADDFYWRLGQSISGVVRDARTNKPITGRMRMTLGGHGHIGPNEVWTDAKGRYRMYVKGGREQTVTCKGSGDYLPAKKPKKVTVKRGQHLANVNFALATAPQYTGVVLYPDGRPVKGAEVTLRASVASKADLGPGIYTGVKGRMWGPVRKVTDEKGRFSGPLRSLFDWDWNDTTKLVLDARAHLPGGSVGSDQVLVRMNARKVQPLKIVLAEGPDKPASQPVKSGQNE